MNILAACSGPDSPVRKVVFKSSAHYYGCEQDDPAFFDETMGRPHPPRTPIERDIVEAEASLNEFAEKNPDVAVIDPALRERARPGRAHLAHRAVLAAGGADDPRLRPALPVRPRGRRGARARARRASRRCPASTTSPATACWRSARSPACSASPTRRCCRLGHRAGGVGAAAPGREDPARDAQPAALRPRRRQPPLQGDRLRYGYTSREAVLKLGEHLRLHPLRARRRGSPTATSARSRSSCAGARTSRTRASKRSAR